MGRDAKPQFDGPPVANRCLSSRQIDFDILVTKKYPIEPGDGFVHRLLDDEEKASAIDMRHQRRSLGGRGNHLKQCERQVFCGLDVDADAGKFAMRRDRRDGDIRVVSQ